MKNLAIVGLGNMGQALLKGLLSKDIIDKKNIFGIEKDTYKIKSVTNECHIKVSEKYDILKKADIIILAVKPQVMKEVLTDIKPYVKNKLIISIAAGITTSLLKEYLNDAKIVRCMPNTPALAMKGITGIFCEKNINDNEKERIIKILSAIGEVLLFDKEEDIDKVTALSGSGPAYVYYFLEALEDAGVLIGLSRDAAKKLAKCTIEGSLALLNTTGKSPVELKEMVTSPGGTTISALSVMEKAGVKGIIMEAVKSAYNRSKELGS